jgi:hypothetical protein
VVGELQLEMVVVITQYTKALTLLSNLSLLFLLLKPKENQYSDDESIKNLQLKLS